MAKKEGKKRTLGGSEALGYRALTNSGFGRGHKGKQHTSPVMLFIGIRRIHKARCPPGRRGGRTPVHPPHAAHTPTNPNSSYGGYFFIAKLPNKSGLQRGEWETRILRTTETLEKDTKRTDEH